MVEVELYVHGHYKFSYLVNYFEQTKSEIATTIYFYLIENSPVIQGDQVKVLGYFIIVVQEVLLDGAALQLVLILVANEVFGFVELPILLAKPTELELALLALHVHAPVHPLVYGLTPGAVSELVLYQLLLKFILVFYFQQLPLDLLVAGDWEVAGLAQAAGLLPA